VLCSILRLKKIKLLLFSGPMTDIHKTSLRCYLVRGGSLSKVIMTLFISEPRIVKVPCGLHYKHMMIVSYASSIINKLEALLTDHARVVIYDHHVFIVQATGLKSDRKIIVGSLQFLNYFAEKWLHLYKIHNDSLARET